MNLTRSSLQIYIAYILNAVISFLAVAFFARELSPTELGSFFIFQAVLGVLSLPADFGIRTAVEKRISEGVEEPDYFTTAIVLKLIPIALLISVIFLVEEAFNQYIGADLALYLGLAIILHETSALAMNVLKGELRAGETAILELSWKLVWGLLGAALVFYGFGVHAIVYSLLIGFLVSSLLGFYKTEISLGSFDAAKARSLLDFSRYSFVGTVAGYSYNWVDVLIIGFFLNQASVAAYEVAWKVAVLVVLLPKAISITVFPKVSQLATKGDIGAIEALYRKVIMPSLVVVTPAAIGVLVLSSEILSVIFGPDYAGASVAFIALVFAKIPDAIREITGRFLLGIDQPQLLARSSIVDIFVNVVLNVLLVLQFGIVGAAVATGLAYLVGTTLRIKYLRQHMRITAPMADIAWSLVAALFMGFVLVSVMRVVTIDSFDRLVSVVGLGVVSYVLALLMSGSIRTTARDLIRNLHDPA